MTRNREHPEEPRVPRVDPRLTKGNLYTIAVIVAGLIGNMGFTHYVPSDAAAEAKKAAQSAVDNSIASAAKSAVVEVKVAEHSLAISEVQASLQRLSEAVAVIQSQNAQQAKAASDTTAKLDELLKAVYREQGRNYRGEPK